MMEKRGGKEEQRDAASFSQWLRTRRKELDLSQAELAQQVGCSFETIKKIETGSRLPSKQVAGLLAGVLGIAPEDISLFVKFARAEARHETAPTFPILLPTNPTPNSRSSPSTPPTPTSLTLVQRPVPNTLPAQLTSFVGRAEEIVDVSERLAKPEMRLLTLIGPPGIGKTRLGLKIASELLSHFEHGVYAVFLASVSNPDLVVPAIAGALGLREAPGQSLLGILKAYLRDREVLLLLDNFEQVLPAAPVMSDLLVEAPRLKVLITSRASLHLYGEYLHAVPPLSTPSLGEAGPVERLAQYESVQLFTARAKAVDEEFSLDGANGLAVSHICARLDGMPLAIELAAARARFLPPTRMLAHLESKLDLLAGSAPNLTPRQRTLRGAINWSYDLLTPAECRLFNRFSVFVGGCTMEAAEEVCASLIQEEQQESKVRRSIPSVPATLQTLVEQSLLQIARGGDEPRYYMLETIREYAGERLAEDEENGTGSEVQVIRKRHAAYYMGLAERATAQLTGIDQAVWMDRLEREHDNFRAALQWTIGEDEAEMAARLGGSLWRFWWTYGYGSEGRQWLESVLNCINAPAIYSQVPAEARAKVVHGAGILERMQGNYGRADLLLRESLALRRALGDKQAMADTLNSLGLLAGHQANYKDARAFFEEGLALFQDIESNSGMAKVLSNFAETLREQGEYSEAWTMMNKSMALNRLMGNKRGVADSLNSLGLLAHYANNDAEARLLLDEAMLLYSEVGVRLGVANVLGNMGDIAMAQGDYQQAEELVKQALAIHTEIGDKRYMSGVLHTLAQVALRRRDYMEAQALLTSSLHMRYELGNKLGIADCLSGLAAVAIGVQGPTVEAAKRALFLCGAVASLLAEVNAPLEPTSRSVYDHTLGVAAQVLDEGTYSEVWQAANAASLEQIVSAAANPQFDA